MKYFKEHYKEFKNVEVKLEYDGRGYYYTDLIPIEDTLDKLKELKGE